MNTNMYNHPLTGTQLNQLKSWGVKVIEPVEKLLACGDVGKIDYSIIYALVMK